MDECLALADPGASINLMLLSVWEGLSLPDLTPTCLTLELADRSVSKPIGIAKDVSFKVGVFHFPADFVVVDFEPDPRVPLILERCFLKTSRALIDVYKGELTLRIENEAVTYNLDQTVRYSANYNQMTANKIDGINPEFYTHKILMEEDYKPAVQHQRRVNPKIYDVIKKEVEILLDAGLIYSISNSPWVSPGGFTMVENEEKELIPTRLVTGWRVCIDYRKLNEATRKDHFPLPFMDQMLERLAENEYYCFLDGFFGYFQIPIDPRDQEKTTFTCPYGTFAYRRMPFGLCNAPGTFQRCMLAIFHDMVEKTMEVFMDDFSVLLLQEFVFDLLDTKGAENLAADHLSRLEKPYENVLDLKEINETFPLETLSTVTFRGDSSAPWFAHFANYHAAKALLTNDARVVCKFLKSLFARFGTPRAIISDRGTYFYNDQFAKVMRKYGVTHHLSTAYHPQTSRQVEVSNRGLKRILERTIGQNHASWSDKLDDAL
nr:reverse transcriptase domain-containing protein [Tanacetum cinerariifolium]